MHSQPDCVNVTGHITLFNPSSMSAKPGTFTLGVYVDNVYVGNATAVNPLINTGHNDYQVTGFLVQTPTNNDARQELVCERVVV